MDKDRNGHLTKEELLQGFEANVDFARALALWDVHREDIDDLWTVMDKDGSGCVGHEEFISALFRMQTESQRSLIYFMYQHVKDIRRQLFQIVDINHMPLQKSRSSQPEPENLEPSANPYLMRHRLAEETQQVQQVKASNQKATGIKIHDSSLNLNEAHKGMESAFACDALPFDIDNFVLKLERHFCELLHNLAETEKVWWPLPSETMNVSTERGNCTYMSGEKDQSTMSLGSQSDSNETHTFLDDIPCETHLQPITSGAVGIGNHKVNMEDSSHIDKALVGRSCWPSVH